MSGWNWDYFEESIKERQYIALEVAPLHYREKYFEIIVETVIFLAFLATPLIWTNWVFQNHHTVWKNKSSFFSFLRYVFAPKLWKNCFFCLFSGLWTTSKKFLKKKMFTALGYCSIGWFKQRFSQGRLFYCHIKTMSRKIRRENCLNIPTWGWTLFPVMISVTSVVWCVVPQYRWNTNNERKIGCSADLKFFWRGALEQPKHEAVVVIGVLLLSFRCPVVNSQ